MLYNSCRNRHCPQCQGKVAQQWLEKQSAKDFNCQRPLTLKPDKFEIILRVNDLEGTLGIRLAHAPLHIAGKRAQEYVGPHPVLGTMMNRTNLQVPRQDGAKGTFDLTQTLVVADTPGINPVRPDHPCKTPPYAVPLCALRRGPFLPLRPPGPTPHNFRR